MKKLLSLICVFAILATCVSIPAVFAGEETDYYHVERFEKDAFIEITDALIELSDGEEYEHTLNIPLGWSWFCTVGKGAAWVHNPADSMEPACIRSTLQEIEGTTYLRRTGTDVAVTKMVDIEPGYKYTLTSTAFSTNTTAAAQSSLAYFLYHKTEDGEYIEINEYLKSVKMSTLKGTNQAVKYDASKPTNEEIYFNETADARSAQLSIDFEVTDASVNAIMVAIGGFGGGSNSRNFAVWHEGFELAQNEEVDLIPNLPTYYAETFTADYVEKEITLNGEWSGEAITYKATHQLPSEEWTVEKYEDGTSDYQIKTYIEKETIVGQSTTAVTKEPFYQIKGSAMRLARYVDIEPGYEYTLDVDATAFLSNGVWSTAHVYLYHKNEDGTYTPINEYLNANNFQKTLETVKFRGTAGYDMGTYAESIRYAAGNGAYDIPVSVAFSITDPNVNAVKITLGGRANKEVWPTAGVYYFGYRIIQGEKVEMLKNDKPPFLTLETVGESKVVRYIPLADKETAPEVIATETIPLVPETYTVDAQWGGYTHPLTIPTGWGWKATGRNSWCDKTTANRLRVVSQGSNKITVITGGDVALTKYVDNIVPGFTYTISSTIYTLSSKPNSGVTLEAWLCNKDENGNYTILSEKPATFAALPKDLTLGSEIATGLGAMKATDITVSIDANISNANAILVAFSGRNNYSGTSEAIATRGFKVTKIPEDKNAPTIVIAAYTVDEDGFSKLEEVAITKNKKTAEGYYEAPYNLDLSGLTGTVKVKAFALNLGKIPPVAKTLIIQ